MIGIAQIGCYIPATKKSNVDLLDKFATNEAFLRDKIGVLKRAQKQPHETASDLCVQAMEDLKQRIEIDLDTIECCVVVTQNPDVKIPHTAAIVHGALGLAETCASFDISLGCSGYVYALAIVSAFMQAQGMSKGLLFTADPYSDIIDPNDKNTALIFGDAATVTLLDEQANLCAVGFDLGSKGADYKKLICENNQLSMNGRAVFNFTAAKVPISVTNLLRKLNLDKTQIKQWYFHQGSKYIVDTITKRLGLDPALVVFDMYQYGNTVSSSIPLLLSQDLAKLQVGDKILLSGFGVGLSWASTVLEQF